MIYFVVNTGYQLYDFQLQLADLRFHPVTLVLIPHGADATPPPGVRALEYRPVFDRGALRYVTSYFELVRRINRDIRPSGEDVCILYTEYELLNQYLARRFKQAAARVLLIEDGGFPTYIAFRLVDSESLSARERLKQLVYRRLPGLSQMRFNKLRGHVYRSMPDDLIDAVCLYRPVSLARKVRTVLLRRPPQPQIAPHPGRVVFLNEDNYNGYQTDAEYLACMQRLLGALSAGFDSVLFKFHPRETPAWRERLRAEVIARHPKVEVIERDTGIEELVEHYRPAVAASFLSAALLNLAERGVEPLYLYHLVPELERLPMFREASAILREAGYRFAPELSALARGYRSGLVPARPAPGALALRELVPGS